MGVDISEILRDDDSIGQVMSNIEVRASLVRLHLSLLRANWDDPTKEGV